MNSGTFVTDERWKKAVSGLTSAGVNAQDLIKVTSAATNISDEEIEIYLSTLHVDRSLLILPGTKETRDKARAVTLIKLLRKQIRPDEAAAELDRLSGRSDAELNQQIHAAVSGLTAPVVPLSDGAIRAKPPEPAPTALMPARMVPRPMTPAAARLAKFRTAASEIIEISRDLRSMSDRDKSALKTKLDGFVTAEQVMRSCANLLILKNGMDRMCVGLLEAYDHFEDALKKDAEAEKAKVELVISIIGSGLAVAGGPLAALGVGMIGRYAANTIVSQYITADTLGSGIAFANNSLLATMKRQITYSESQGPWAANAEVTNAQALNQTLAGRAALAFRNLLDRSIDVRAVPGRFALKDHVMSNYESTVHDMAASICGGLEGVIGSIDSKHIHGTVLGRMDRIPTSNPHLLSEQFVEYAIRNGYAVLLNHSQPGRDGSFWVGVDKFIDALRERAFKDWNDLFATNSVMVTTSDSIELFRDLCEAKLWCRTITTEQSPNGRKRAPKAACLERLDQLGIIQIWRQSLRGALAGKFGIGSMSDEDKKIREAAKSAGRLRYHGSDWEKTALYKVAAFIDNDKNVNIPNVALGRQDVTRVWETIKDYIRRIVTEREDQSRSFQKATANA